MFTQRNYLVAAAALALLALAGCQNSAPTTAQSSAAPQRAIVVTGNTGNYTVFLSSVDPNDPVVLCSAGTTTVCPECKAAAIKYFQTGVLDPKCSRTGATRSPIVAVDTSVGHQ